jgi:transcriptional regulator
MYCPTHFQEDSPAALIALIQAHPLGTVICHTASGLVADHIPLLFKPEADTAGKLMGHVASSNPMWQLPHEQELLVVFQGPSAYISPNWYATKADAGRVVPTWNYAVVHAYCSLKAIREPSKVLAIVSELTDHHESKQPHPWRVSDAPGEFTDRLLGNIVGVELSIHRLHGKWKVSQNQPAGNQASVVAGLRGQGADCQNEMAELVEAYGGRQPRS